MKYFIEEYDNSKSPEESNSIKWSRNLNRRKISGRNEKYDSNRIQTHFYRPFNKRLIYYSKLFIDECGSSESVSGPNKFILVRYGNRVDFSVISTDVLPNLATFSLDPSQYISLYYYSSGTRHDNITDWGLEQFRVHYSNRGDSRIRGNDGRNEPLRQAQRDIEKEDIFHYTYGVLHNPAYREKYAQNLRREFPRLPFYEDFRQWATWGKSLLDLHIGYEEVEPYPLKSVTLSLLKGDKPKTKLKADKAAGTIELDEVTTLSGIPAEAWEYKLGNRSALEWILDQYKEKTPKDKTIVEKFNTYRFADYKEQVIDLLKQVCTVSVETMKIVREMEKVKG